MLPLNRYIVRLSLIVTLAIGSSSCSTAVRILSISDVKPWERGSLAREEMLPITDSLERRVDDHIYFSKEASTGGVSVQGGGCGCN